MISWIRRNCSDNVGNDMIFKSTMIQYKAYLLKSGHSEELVDKQFISYALKVKRRNLLEKKTRKKSDGIVKYQMVTDFEPTFPDIKKAFRKFQHIIVDDEELKEVFPKGVKHFRSSERRGSINVKEILAPSTVKFKQSYENINCQQNVDEDPKGYLPCDKPCVYCDLLRKSQGTVVDSKVLQTRSPSRFDKILDANQEMLCI